MNKIRGPDLAKVGVEGSNPFARSNYLTGVSKVPKTYRDFKVMGRGC
jgi:hypothetical protein